MGKKYTKEFKQHLVEEYAKGRSYPSLSKEYGEMCIRDRLKEKLPKITLAVDAWLLLEVIVWLSIK